MLGKKIFAWGDSAPGSREVFAPHEGLSEAVSQVAYQQSRLHENWPNQPAFILIESLLTPTGRPIHTNLSISENRFNGGRLSLHTCK